MDELESKLCMSYPNYLLRPRSTYSGSGDKFPPLTGYRFKRFIHP